MAKKNTFGMGRRKKNHLLEGLVILTIGAVVVTSVLTGTFLYVSSSIHKNQAAIEALSDEITILEEETGKIQNQEAEYKKQLEVLQGELSKYEPVVIPDSMKKASTN